MSAGRDRFEMKRKICFVLCFTFLAACLCGCATSAKPANAEKPSVIVTIAPVYDWVCQLAGDRLNAIDVFLLTKTGEDLHNYQPSVDDMVRIADCDLFIYVGGVSDAWVQDALAGTNNHNTASVNLLQTLGSAAKTEETVEGMEPDEDEAQEPEADEHVWLSLKNAVLFCRAIADALTRLDPDGKADYARNLQAYTERLQALDDAYAKTVQQAKRNVVLFGDRFPFRYLTDDYGLTYYAAFAGCSAESEASFKTVAFLAQKIDELALPTVLTIDGSDQKLARTVIEATKAKNARIAVLDSMQAGMDLTKHDYVSVMKDNLTVLQAALN